jgi:hypothetical protein
MAPHAGVGDSSWQLLLEDQRTMIQGRGAGPGFCVAPMCDAYMLRMGLPNSALLLTCSTLAKRRLFRNLSILTASPRNLVATGLKPPPEFGIRRIRTPSKGLLQAKPFIFSAPPINIVVKGK